VKPYVIQVTDRGITGGSDKQSSPELTTEGNVFGDDAAFREPPSEEQFKDEDLFYLHDISRESDLTDDITSTESSVKHKNSDSSLFRDEFNSESGEIDLTEELGFSKSPSDIQFTDKDLHGTYGNSEIQDYIEPTESIHLLDNRESTTNISSPQYAHDFSSPDLSSSFSTKKPHRFRTPTTTLPPITSDSRTVQSMVSSTEEPLEQKVLVTKSTSKPHTTVSYIDVEGLATHPLSKLIRNDDVSTRQPMRSRPTSTPVSLSTAPTTVSPTTEDPVSMKLKPIFVEIIHRGSSEPPLLKTYTVEELERRRSTTKSPLSSERDNLSSRNPERTASRSQTVGPGEMSTTLIVSPSPVTLSRRARPPKKLITLTPVPDITPTKFTASVPPTTLFVTLSRKIQPPVLILTSSEPHDKNKMESDDTPPESSKFGTRDMSSSTDHTTPISPVTLSRRVQPPLAGLVEFSSGLSTSTSPTVRQDRQEIVSRTANHKPFVSFQTMKNYILQNTGKHQLLQEADFEHDILISTESSASRVRSNSESTKNSVTYVDEIQHQTTSEPSPITTLRQQFFSMKQRLMTDTIESTTPSLNTSLEKVILTREPTAVSDIPISLALKQEPTSSSQYRNRDGLAIPASSGPSTLHSLAVYFAAKDSNQETTVDMSTDFYSRKHKGKGEKTTTASVPTSSSILEYDSEAEVNETDTPILAPNFLTKSTRDSYSVLFPNTNEEQNTATEEPVRSTTRTAEKSSAKIKIKDGKAIYSSHNVLSSELLDKLAEISEMEAKPPSEKRVPSSEREVLHSETEDLLQGTDSRDLRELAQIFSRALSAYLEDPEEFKRVLTKVRPQDPSSVYVNDVKQVESNQFSSTTVTSVSSSTAIPLTTSSTEYFSVTQEDEEVLDFSDVSKVSRKKSKLIPLMPPYSKSLETQKRKDSVSTSYINSAVVTTSRKTGVAETASKPSSIEALEETDLKPSEEGLQNAQSTYYTSPNGRVPLNTASVSPEVFEHPQKAEGSGVDYTLPPGTKQYQGPEYGPQPDEVKFAPTAGGVNDPSRPRYGGFQNNSGIPTKETSIKSINTQGIVKATTFVPEVRYQTRSTVHPVSTTADVQKPLAKEVADEFGNILNTFVPQEVNNLAIVGSTPETPGASLDDENVQKGHVQTYNLMSSSHEALLGVNTTSFTSSSVSQPSNTLSVEQKWSSLGNIVDALAINRELSESDIEERKSSAVAQEFSSSVVTTQKPTSTAKPVFKTRHRSTTESYITEPAVHVVDSEDPTTTLHDIPGTSTKPPQTQRYRHSQLELEADSANSNEGSSYNSSPQEQVQPLDISGVTFYSEKIKPLPPASASLIQVSVSKTYRVEPLISSSTGKYMSGKVSVFDNSVKEISETTTTENVPLRKQPVSTTQTYPPTMESESTLSLRKFGTKNRSFHSEQSSRSTQEPDIMRQDLIKNAMLREAPEMLLPHRQSMPAPFTEAAFSETLLTAEIKQETKQSEQEIPSVDLQPVQSSVGVPLSATIPSSRGITSSRGTKNTTKQSPEGIVVPNTSTSALASANSSSVIVSPNNNISSRGTKSSENHKSLNKKVTPTELKDASNSQQSVRISTMVYSTESPTSSNSTTIPTFVKIFSSNRSLLSVPRTSVEADLRMDDVTTDQLQALEDIQTMLFPANSTMSKDGTMFNNLNRSSTLSLINTMKQAVTNSTVRRLVLLLVNSLKENTPEETQSHLIAALLRIPVDHKLSEAEQVSVSTLLQQRMESLTEKSNEEHTPVTVSQCKSHPNDFLEKSSQIPMIEQSDCENKHLTTTQASATKFRTRGRKNPQILTAQEHPTTVAVQSKGRRPVRLRTTTESSRTEPSVTSSLEKESGSEDLAKEGDSLPPSDTRAVELLRSLYSLASRWG
jgi:hypothetical protein